MQVRTMSKTFREKEETPKPCPEDQKSSVQWEDERLYKPREGPEAQTGIA